LWCGANVDGKKKSDEESKEETRKRIDAKGFFVAKDSGV
jgi:hypothetical protein